VLNFATMTSRKPITEGFLNPHEERFVLPKNQFPEILTKHHHQPKVNIKGFANRNSSKQFLTTGFTGLLHYQPEIPKFYPDQPGYVGELTASHGNFSEITSSHTLQKSITSGFKINYSKNHENHVIRDLLSSARGNGRSPPKNATVEPRVNFDI
jgi:hypothetical protein